MKLVDWIAKEHGRNYTNRRTSKIEHKHTLCKWHFFFQFLFRCNLWDHIQFILSLISIAYIPLKYSYFVILPATYAIQRWCRLDPRRYIPICNIFWDQKISGCVIDINSIEVLIISWHYNNNRLLMELTTTICSLRSNRNVTQRQQKCSYNGLLWITIF